MDFQNNQKLASLFTKLQTRLAGTDLDSSTFTTSTLELELSNALLEYYNDRHFTPTDDTPYEDIYAGIIVELATCALMRYGVEGENYHSEGGIIRTYDNASQYPLSLTRKIIPLAKGVDM